MYNLCLQIDMTEEWCCPQLEVGLGYLQNCPHLTIRIYDLMTCFMQTQICCKYIEVQELVDSY